MSRVAIINNHWMPYKDLLFRALAKLDCQFVAVFAARGGAQRQQAVTLQGYEYRIGFDGDFERANKFETLHFTWTTLEELKPAVAIIEGWATTSAWTAWVWALSHRVPIVLWSESNDFAFVRQNSREIVKRLFVRFASFAHVYGNSNKLYLEDLGMSSEVVFTGRAVIDTDRLAALPATAGSKHPLRFLYIGRLVEEKNLETLITAFGHAVALTDEPISLKIVGSGPLEATLTSLAGLLSLNGLVDFQPSVPYEQLGSIYQQSDIFVLPSMREPWGLVAAEAMCAGLPAIISDKCGCASDLLTPETGWAFDPTDAEGLGELMTEISAISRSRIQNMGKAAQARAKHYSPQRAAEIVSRTINLAVAR